VASSRGDCDGVAAWVLGTEERLQHATPIVRGIDPDGGLPTEATLLAHERTMWGLATAQRQSAPPPAAEEINGVMVALFEGFAYAMAVFADVAAGDEHPFFAQTKLNAGKGAIAEAGGDIAHVVLDLYPVLTTRCPR